MPLLLLAHVDVKCLSVCLDGTPSAAAAAAAAVDGNVTALPVVLLVADAGNFPAVASREVELSDCC